MKKIIAIVLAAIMLLTLVACGGNGNDTTENPEAEKTLADVFVEKFNEVKNADPSANSEAIAIAILESKLATAIPSPMMVPVEPDTFLQGIGTDGVTFGGFVSGTVIAPMMMGIPFMLYVFDLGEGVVAADFAKEVETNANPAWNVCAIAEETRVAANGNCVILVMCQKAIPGSVSGVATVVEPELTEGSEAETVWNGFKTVMSEMTSPELSAEEIATGLSAAFDGEVAPVMDVISNDIFLYEIDSYNAATITNGDKVVYIFVLDMGVDVENWTSYYCSAVEGANLVYGSYDNTVVAMVNLD